MLGLRIVVVDVDERISLGIQGHKTFEGEVTGYSNEGFIYVVLDGEVETVDVPWESVRPLL